MLLGLKLVGSELHLTRDTDIAIYIHIYIFSVEKKEILYQSSWSAKLAVLVRLTKQSGLRRVLDGV